ncbi:MAG: hypothetical protein IJM30_09825 [Thermoguttaceae bacterium]|nr:hypothetical protein [Thermoguttaceae bacterium]
MTPYPNKDDESDVFDDSAEYQEKTLSPERTTETDEDPSVKRRVRRLDADARIARYNSVRRGLWATAAIGGVAYIAVLAAVFAGLREPWAQFQPALRLVVLGMVLALTYTASLIAARLGNPPLSKLLSVFGVAFFGVALALSSKGAPNALNVDCFGKLANSFASIAPLWAIGAFALAATFRVRTLHYCAAAVVFLWLLVDSTGRDAIVAIVFCAIGEYWAWKRKSASIAAIYFLLCVWILCTDYSIWRVKEAAALVAVALSVLTYWFGATFKSSIVRGFALLVAACALGVASFPFYWKGAFSDDFVQRHMIGAVYIPTFACVVMFVLYCANLTLRGAQASLARFTFGIVALVVWIVARTLYAARSTGSLGVVFVLILIASFLSALVALEFHLRKRYGWSGSPTGSIPVDDRREEPPKKLAVKNKPMVPTDDPEFDDMFEREARAMRDAEPVLALQIAYEDGFEKLVALLRQPLIGSAVLFQFALLIANFVLKWR